MENKKKGLFTGFGSVFSFTAEQNMKGKGFKLSSIGIGLAILIVAALVPIVMAVTQKPDEYADDEYGIEENLGGEDGEEEVMDAIVVLNHGQMEEGMLEGFLALCGYEDVQVEYSDINVENGYKEFAEYCVGNYDRPLGLRVELEEESIAFHYYVFDESNLTTDYVEKFAHSFDLYYGDMKYVGAGMSETEIEVLNMPVWTNVSEADGKEREMGVVLMEMLAPVLVSMLMLMMTVMHGQSVTRVVMSEKSSKLMEVLLTSVKPYGLLAGKIVATAVIAIVQLFIWLVLLVVGFVAGDRIGAQIYPEYQNYVLEIIDLIADSGTGFTAGAVIIALLILIVGFIMYCVWAGFIASVVDKVDDVSTAMSLFQIPVMAGWMISYMGSMLGWKTVMKISDYIPIVSPFVTPANVLIGKTSIVGGLLSLLVLVVFTVGMILITGKVYKGKIFNRK